jgi:uncharacterized membrane protein (DUF106 family)
MHLVVLSGFVAILIGLFGWYMASNHRHQRKETEIRRLKEDLKKEIQDTCAAAKKGDSSAVMKMKALQDTITEQSVRLTGRPKPPTTIIKGGIPGLKS